MTSKQLNSHLSAAALGLVFASCSCAPPTGTACKTDVDCPGAQVCSKLYDVCVQCAEDSHCPSGLCLADGTCGACGPNAACPQGQLCGVDGQCKPGCESPTAGCANGRYCLATSPTCVECLNDLQCGPGRICDVDHVCRQGCSQVNPTCSPTQLCDLDGGTCVGCLTSADCHHPSLPACDLTRHTCVGCVTSSDCHQSGLPICDSANHVCVGCTADQDCGPGSVCGATQTCVPGCSAAHQACPSGQVCDTVDSQCVACVNDHQCSAGAPRCDPSSHGCVACLPSSDNCPMGEYCRPDDLCERGCKVSTDCPSGICLPDHSCGGCTADAQCAAGNVCQNGSCIAACSATNPCGAGQECCGQRCVDSKNDPSNCGACGTVCGAGAACCNSACQRLDTATHCGACGATCAAGQDCCGGACQSTTTLQRCGACTNVCTADQFCDGQACQNVVFPNFCANKKVYAIYDGIALDDAATDVLASTIQANCSQTTVVTYGPQSNPQWVDQATGQLLLGSGSTVVTAGGPFPNKPVKWMERTQQVTRVYFSTNGIDTFSFKKRSDNSTVIAQPAATCSAHHDLFVVELAKDPGNGTLALISYGVCNGGYGTQASAWFYANQMLPNRSAWPDSWYIFEWTDTNNDSLPNAGDSFVKRASGL